MPAFFTPIFTRDVAEHAKKEKQKAAKDREIIYEKINADEEYAEDEVSMN